MVRLVDRDDIGVGSENVPAVESLQSVECLLLERRLDLLGDDAAAEDPGEPVTDDALELALEALDDTHTDLLPNPLRVAVCPH